jgi:hypothetical protein
VREPLALAKAEAETDGAREESEDRDEVEEWADPG